MNESTKEIVDKPVKPSTNNKQRGFCVIELLFAAATIGATVVALGIPNPKIPRSASD